MIKRLNSYFWLIFLPAHLFLALALVELKITALNVGLIFLFWLLVSGYGVGVGLHRLLSHKSFKTWYWAEVVVSYLGCLAIQGSPIFWVNMHRGYHHPFSDTDKDIHSPVKGRLWAYLLWPIMIEYKSIKFDFVNDLMRKKVHRFLHFMYFPVVWLTWALAYLTSPQIFYVLVIAQLVSLHQEFCVNLFCHTGKGYRNFELPDHSVNRYFFGLLFWGVGFHNNHHARPNSYDFAYAANEFDPTTLLVRAIKKEE